MSGVDHLLQASAPVATIPKRALPLRRRRRSRTCGLFQPAAHHFPHFSPLPLPTLLPQLLRKQQEAVRGARGGGADTASPAAATHRFLVTKLSWRGSYRRLLCVTPTHLLTLYPDTLAVTNSWAFAGDHDLAGVEVGGEHGADGGTLTFHFRRDKKVGGQTEGRHLHSGLGGRLSNEEG